jgi:hypothetical protein
LSLYSSLEGQRQTVCGGYSELPGSPYVIVKINDLGNFLEQLTLQTLTAFGYLKSWEGYRISHTCTLRETSRMHEGVHMGYETGNNYT